MNNGEKLIFEQYLNIINYGINNVGQEMDTACIKEAFKDKAEVVDDDPENIEVWATNHAYLGQDHLCLSFGDNRFNGLIDFDLMPKDNLIKPEEKNKRLVNFKAQVFIKDNPTGFISLNAVIYLTLKKQYGNPNDFSNFDNEKQKVFAEMHKSLQDHYKSLGANPNAIAVWYIKKQEIYYLASFYYFKGTKDVPPYLSFAITEMFKFNE